MSSKRFYKMSHSHRAAYLFSITDYINKRCCWEIWFMCLMHTCTSISINGKLSQAKYKKSWSNKSFICYLPMNVESTQCFVSWVAHMKIRYCFIIPREIGNSLLGCHYDLFFQFPSSGYVMSRLVLNTKPKMLYILKCSRNRDGSMKR